METILLVLNTGINYKMIIFLQKFTGLFLFANFFHRLTQRS